MEEVKVSHSQGTMAEYLKKRDEEYRQRIIELLPLIRDGYPGMTDEEIVEYKTQKIIL